jgi:DNA segregation ATPase FtsK/SpoIIIE-like protein
MRFPFTLDGNDIVVGVTDHDITVGATAEALRGAPITEQWGGAIIAGRPVRLDESLIEVGVRPGDEVLVATNPAVAVAPSGWAVHVVAGVDAGRTIALQAPAGTPITVGRGAAMDVRLNSNAVSTHHCTLMINIATSGTDAQAPQPGSVTVTDGGSRNGTVVRGHRIGDTPETVEFGEAIRCGPTVIVVRAIVSADAPRNVAAMLRTAPSGPVPFYRSPVDLVASPGPQVALPAPPRRPRTGRPGLIGLVISLAMAAALVAFTGQWFYALFALMGPLMILITTAEKASRNRRTRRRSRRRYRQEIVEFREELADAVNEEVQRRWLISPDLAELSRRCAVSSALLWSRRRDHPHFLELALGVGDVPWDPPVAQVPDDDDVPELEAMVEAAKVLPLAPLTVSAIPGTVLGLAGLRASALASARGLLLQLSTLHGPAEVRVVVVVAQGHDHEWEWVKWLPHVRPTFADSRLLAIVSAPDGRIDGAAVDEVLADVDAEAALVAVIDTTGLTDAGDVAIRRLLRRRDLKATGIVIAATADGLPDQCDVVIEHHESLGEATVRWPREGGRSVYVVIAGTTTATALGCARALARLSDPDAGGGSASLPARVSHGQLLGLVDGAGSSLVTAKWAHAGRLSAVAGLGEDSTVSVDLDADGPHLTVIGGRGSGKTEQLAALVLSLAATQPPERLHLVLWGESFSHLHRLPHVASTVSRIDEGTLKQFNDGLDRELTRRERLRTQDASAAMAAPKLVVVIDDIDSITRLLPLAPEGFVRLLRRARGLGVHVVWSAGRHTGGSINELVDLSSIRIVLRVASAPDSTDLLGSDAAARLERSLPGRGYVVAGRADPREIQGGAVSVGAPSANAQLDITAFTLAAGRSGFVTETLAPPAERSLVAVISAAGATSARPPDLLSTASGSVGALESPGLLELLGLDQATGLSTVTETWHTIDADSFLRVPIGVDPEMKPVLLDLKESAMNGMGPHGLLVGATGAGKSELLRTLVCGLALTHSPEALAFVLVDFKGGASFASLGALPHVAGVVTNLADDLALVDRILAALGGEQRRRQELLAAAGNLGNVREYRALRREGKLPPDLQDQPLPQLLVILDEFAELLDQEPAFIDFFLTIGRVGRSLGIHLLLASQRLEEGKLRGLDTYLSYRLGLRTFSAVESRIVLGVPDAYSLPTAPGGGYLKVGSTSFERFQASYVSGPSASGSGSVLDAVIAHLRDAAPPVHQIWLAPLDAELPLDSVFGSVSRWDVLTNQTDSASCHWFSTLLAPMAPWPLPVPRRPARA